MAAYDTILFDPPAPLARVTLRNSETGMTWSDVPMLLDSGADVTLIPQAAINILEVSIAPNENYKLTGFDGSISSSPVVKVELIFLKRIFRGQFLLIEQEWGIIGRNVLNTVPLLFDGPRLMWDEHRFE